MSRKVRQRWIAGWTAAGLAAAGLAIVTSNSTASATATSMTMVQPLTTGTPSPSPTPTATPTPSPTPLANGQHIAFTQSPANPVMVGTIVTYTVTVLTPVTSVYIEIDAGRFPTGKLNYVGFGDATAPGGGASTVLTLQHTWTTPGTNNLVATLSFCDDYDCGGLGDFADLTTVVTDGSSPSPTVTVTPSPTPTVTPTLSPTPTPSPTRTPAPVVFNVAASGKITVTSLGGAGTLAPQVLRINVSATRTSFTTIPATPTLSPVKITGSIFGFIPWSVTESISATTPISGVIANGAVSLSTSARVSVTSANLAGIALSGATTCQTTTGAPLKLTSTGALPPSGGSVTGAFTPGTFANCGNFTQLLTALYAGATQQLRLNLASS